MSTAFAGWAHGLHRLPRCARNGPAGRYGVANGCGEVFLGIRWLGLWCKRLPRFARNDKWGSCGLFFFDPVDRECGVFDGGAVGAWAVLDDVGVGGVEVAVVGLDYGGVGE